MCERMRRILVGISLLSCLLFVNPAWPAEQKDSFIPIEEAVESVRNAPKVKDLMLKDQYRGLNITHLPSKDEPFFRVDVNYQSTEYSEEDFRANVVRKDSTLTLDVDAYTGKAYSAGKISYKAPKPAAPKIATPKAPVETKAAKPVAVKEVSKVEKPKAEKPKPVVIKERKIKPVKEKKEKVKPIKEKAKPVKEKKEKVKPIEKKKEAVKPVEAKKEEVKPVKEKKQKEKPIKEKKQKVEKPKAEKPKKEKPQKAVKEKKVKQAPEVKEKPQAKKDQTLKARLEENYGLVRQKWLKGAPEYRKSVKKSTPLFLSALKDKNGEARLEGAKIIGQLASPYGAYEQYKIKQAVPALKKLLKDSDPQIRFEALVALGYLGDKGDKKLIDTISPLIKDSDPMVRNAAIKSLGELGGRYLVPIFIDLLGDKNVHREAVRALSKLRDERAVEPLSRLLDKKEYPYLQKDAIQALGNTGSKKSIPRLTGLLNKEYAQGSEIGGYEQGSPYMGCDAAKALAKIGKDSLPTLIESLKSKDRLDRLYSTYALNLINDQSALGPLDEALKLEEDPIVKIYMQKAIAEIKGEKFTTPALEIEISAEAVKDKYKAYEPIKLFLRLENKGASPAIINSLALNYADTTFKIIGPDNEPVSYSGPKLRRDLIPAKNNLLALGSGDLHKPGFFPIKDYYDFEKPGTYQITCIYDNDFTGIDYGLYIWTGKVESKPITIEVE